MMWVAVNSALSDNVEEVSRKILESGLVRKSIVTASGPDGIRLVISISMQFEAGGQPSKGTDGPLPKWSSRPAPSDAAANTWFAYGYREGTPMLD